jgi:hypothetical protein
LCFTSQLKYCKSVIFFIYKNWCSKVLAGSNYDVMNLFCVHRYKNTKKLEKWMCLIIGIKYWHILAITNMWIRLSQHYKSFTKMTVVRSSFFISKVNSTVVKFSVVSWLKIRLNNPKGSEQMWASPPQKNLAFWRKVAKKIYFLCKMYDEIKVDQNTILW